MTAAQAKEEGIPLTQSFGADWGQPPQPEPEPAAAGTILPPVQLPMAVVVDQAALRMAEQEIQAMVARAVRNGFAEGVGPVDPPPQT